MSEYSAENADPRVRLAQAWDEGWDERDNDCSEPYSPRRRNPYREAGSSPALEAAGIAVLLAEHEARWTTHGWDRLYEVIHCVGDCDWSLRQKALMTDDYCYEAHRAHVAEEIVAAMTKESA